MVDVSGTRYWRTGRSGSSLFNKYFAVSFGPSCMLIICFVAINTKKCLWQALSDCHCGFRFVSKNARRRAR